MTTTQNERPATQDRRPSLQRKHTRSTEAKREDGLDEGLAFTDPADGTRIQVLIRDVKGKHDAALVAATGYDFMGLLQALNERQGLDLMAAAVWFVRMVNGREAQTYVETLDDFGYEDLVSMDLGVPEKVSDRPEA